MQVFVESDPSSINQGDAAAAPVCPEPEAAPLAAMDLVYDLRLGAADCGGFQQAVAAFSDQLLLATERCAGFVLEDYASYVRAVLREAPRSRGEYCLDLLLLGMALERYMGAAESTPGWVVGLARELYWLRTQAAWCKPLVDLGRGALIRFFLAPRIGCKAGALPYSHARMSHLIDWLQATGEFEQEIRRLNNWRRFLDTLSKDEANRWAEVAIALFGWFVVESAGALGAFTQGVPAFLASEFARRGIREDQIFCGRPQVEYHLAMVSAEIMNRGLLQEFQGKRKKVVLLPACMRGQRAADCRAHVSGVDITCAGCDPACAINRITKRMRSLGVKVYLVPHSTGFSRWLERWQHEPDTGVVAAACLLNILPGGYEMRARRISSQCIPLDYPGCQKHWRPQRLSTKLNEDRLAQIVTAAPLDPASAAR